MTLALSAALVSAPTDLGPTAPEGMGCLMALIAGATVPLPLQRVAVRAEIAGDNVRTVIRQRFLNAGAEALEVTYIFPLPPAGAMTGLALVVGERRVEAALAERKQAEADFSAARAAGQLAGIITQERKDVHTLKLTRVPSGAVVEVEVQLEERLTAADGALWWRLPTVLAPRYTPGAAVGHSGDGVLADTDAVPDASRLSPPLRLGGGAQLELEVQLRGPWAGVATSQHSMAIELTDGGAVLRPAGPATCDRDFVLRLLAGAAPAERLAARTDGRFTEVVLHPAVLGAMGAACPRDAVYLLDISGSMEGAKMAAAKLALQTAISTLGPQDTLQIIAFDDRIERWSPAPQAVSTAALQKARAWIHRQDARGGTELLPALHEALAQDATPGRLRTVLVITDGQSSDEHRLLPAVAGRRGRTVVSTLGIDTAVNEALLRDLAEVGGGVCGLCTPSDDIEAAVARLELAVGSPQAAGLTVHALPAGLDPVDAPRTLFSGRPLVWVLEGAPAEVELRGDGLSLRVPVRPGAPPLAARWARARLSALVLRRRLRPFEAEAIDPELTRVSLAGGVLGPTTAWLAVDRATVTGGGQRSVVQPVALPHAWAEGAAPQADVMGGGAPAPMGKMASRPMMASMPAPRGAPMGPPPSAAPAPGRARSAAPPPPAPIEVADDVMLGSAAPMADHFDAEAEEAPALAAPAASGLFGALSRGIAALGESAKAAVAPRAAKKEKLAERARDEAPSPPADRSGAGREQQLVAAQAPDGSFAGGVGPTIAAVMELLARGHSRQLGLRQRTVRKAVDWLVATAAADPRVIALIALLDAAEAAGAPPAAAWGALRAQLGADGAALPALP